MNWADFAAGQIENKLADHIKNKPKLMIRDEKSVSGRVHIGAMRGAAIHGLIGEILTEKKIGNEYWYEFNDLQPFDSIPQYLDQAAYEQYLGLPLYAVPSPDPSASNFPEWYGKEFASVIDHAGFHPTYYWLSQKYREGAFNECIKIALDNADTIRDIYKRESGSVKNENWYPISIICESCGKIATTEVTDWNGNDVVYHCKKDIVAWTSGCGHKGRVSPMNGQGQLPWKVEWAAKFKVFDVDIEGAGKDHTTRGGARDVANAISQEVFHHEPPFDLPYEFFLVGGSKMSSSKGHGSFAKDVADLLPPHIFRLALIGKDIKKQVNFDPAGDTVPLLFDQFDKIAEKFWHGLGDDDTRLFELIHFPEERASIPQRFLPRFRDVAYITQMPHLDFEKEMARMKGGPLTDIDRKEAHARAKVAQYWLATYAPEQFRFELQTESIPQATQFFVPMQKRALQKVLAYVEAHKTLDGQELHTALHDIRQEFQIEPKDFFGALYYSLLGKPSGPKMGWFLSVLDRNFLIQRLKDVSREA